MCVQYLPFDLYIILLVSSKGIDGKVYIIHYTHTYHGNKSKSKK